MWGTQAHMLGDVEKRISVPATPMLSVSGFPESAALLRALVHT